MLSVAVTSPKPHVAAARMSPPCSPCHRRCSRRGHPLTGSEPRCAFRRPHPRRGCFWRCHYLAALTSGCINPPPGGPNFPPCFLGRRRQRSQHHPPPTGLEVGVWLLSPLTAVITRRRPWCKPSGSELPCLRARDSPRWIPLWNRMIRGRFVPPLGNRKWNGSEPKKK